MVTAEAADWVKGLKKPSRAAWLVNQLAVRKPDEVAELLEVGEELRAAQEEMLAGSADRERLRDLARREQRGGRHAAAERPRRSAASTGWGSRSSTRVGETLRAAAGDPEVAEAIGAGGSPASSARRRDRAGRRGRARQAPAAAKEGQGPGGGRAPLPPAAGEAPQGGRAQARRRREAARARAGEARARPRVGGGGRAEPSTPPSSTPTPPAATWTRSSASLASMATEQARRSRSRDGASTAAGWSPRR